MSSMVETDDKLVNVWINVSNLTLYGRISVFVTQRNEGQNLKSCNKPELSSKTTCNVLICNFLKPSLYQCD